MWLLQNETGKHKIQQHTNTNVENINRPCIRVICVALNRNRPIKWRETSIKANKNQIKFHKRQDQTLKWQSLLTQTVLGTRTIYSALCRWRALSLSIQTNTRHQQRSSQTSLKSASYSTRSLRWTWAAFQISNVNRSFCKKKTVHLENNIILVYNTIADLCYHRFFNSLKQRFDCWNCSRF